MKYNSSQNGGGRRSGGGNYRGQRGSGGPRPQRERSNYGTRETTPAPKPTFWEKLIGFFTGKKSSAKTNTATTASSSYSSRNRPERPPYQGGGTRNSSERTERPERAASTPRTARKPELVEVTTPKLYVGNLSFEATESDLFDLFNGVGKVRNAEVVSNQYTQKSKGFAFVIMETVDEAKRAVLELHDKEFLGRKLVVSGAKTSERDERPEREERAQA